MTRLFLAALMLSLAPLAATAQDCPDRVKFSCPQGQNWDEKTKTCVIPSS